jgi:Fur family ferric uptake transcriptional regulator
MSGIHTCIETLRQRGYRITPQREMIIEAIAAQSSHHITAEMVFDLVRHRTSAMNIATVYRTLDCLVREGLASRTDLGDGQITYATARHGPHIHLVCRQCGCVIEADLEPATLLCDYFQQEHGFAIDLHHFSLSGVCAECQSEQEQQEQEA